MFFEIRDTNRRIITPLSRGGLLNFHFLYQKKKNSRLRRTPYLEREVYLQEGGLLYEGWYLQIWRRPRDLPCNFVVLPFDPPQFYFSLHFEIF